MSDNAEAGIAGIQAKTAQKRGAAGLGQFHDGTVSYLNERIVTFVMLIAAMSLGLLWATTDSTILHYASLGGVILLVVAWGLFRLRRLEAIRRERASAAEAWQPGERE